MQDQVQSPEQMSFEEAMRAALGRDPIEAAPEPVAVEPKEPEAPPATPQVPAEAPKPVEPAPKPAEAAPDPSIKALMDREAAAVAKESALREAEADIRSLRERVDAYEQARKTFLLNPAEFIRSLAPDVPLSKLAEDLWFEDLGEAAPAEYKLKKEVRGAKAEVHDLRNQQTAEAKRQAEEKSRMEAETALNQYVGQLKETIPQLAADKNPLVKSLAAQNSDMAIRMMLDAASYAAQEGKMLTPAEAAEAVESYLKQFSPLFASPPAPEVKASPTEQNVKPVPTSLRNSSVSVQTPRVPADPNDPKVLRRNALIEAGINPDDPSVRSWLEE
jgi:hypothetical protein